ncbi:hypothetical protein J0895_17850 [Phormidium pseudopriestleyi FRX01]|uniref:Uncharacterized protein n=1 Tax=Phormidium pseudopriestleyi FRX01 TaxID=1759528 RepID=A0ABS3FUU2_9CYAN|nr:hypothetical protein [Phormidium pseudopriestleyi]MBO0350895.1 hypothetical protein [Phormidium pseudopriestleyi FRX01]
MLGPTSEAQRHQSTSLEGSATASRNYRTDSRTEVGRRNAWEKEEMEMEKMLRDLPDLLSSLESFRERSTRW